MFKKEKQVVELIVSHADKTAECVEIVVSVLKACLPGGDGSAAVDAGAVGELERDADGLLREIREVMYSGAYLPLIRGDIYRLMSKIDDVANKAEECCDLCYLQKPIVGEEYQRELVAIMDLTIDCYSELREALRSYFDPKGELDQQRTHLHNVGKLETAIDTKARQLTEQIFASAAPLAEKLHLQMFLASIIRISDVTEDAADELDLLSVMSIV